MSPHNQEKINELHPKLRPIAQIAWQECEDAMPGNTELWIDQAYRTFADSDALYAQGRTAPGSIVTNAKAGQSYHNYALAWDFHMITNGKDDWQVGPLWMKVVAIMQKHGFTWGGTFTTIKDNPHFEMRFGYNWRDLLAKHNSGDLISGTTYVNI
jgi:hypothetical protein